MHLFFVPSIRAEIGATLPYCPQGPTSMLAFITCSASGINGIEILDGVVPIATTHRAAPSHLMLPCGDPPVGAQSTVRRCLVHGAMSSSAQESNKLSFFFFEQGKGPGGPGSFIDNAVDKRLQRGL
jgi:hypothetical protein